MLAAEAGSRGRGRRRPQPAGADPVRQLGDPPERRRGHRRRCASAIHLDGRTAIGVDDASPTRRARRRSSSARSTPCAWRPLDPGWPGLAPPRRPAAVPPRRPGDGRRHARRPGRRRRRVRRRRRRAGDRRLLPHRPLVGRLRQLGRPGRRRASSADVGVAGIARRDGCRRRGAGGVRPARRHRRRGARRPGRGEGATPAVDPVELPPGRYEVVLEPTAVADVLEWLCWFGFNAKAVAERRSFVRLGDAQFDPAITPRRRRAGGRAGRTTPTARRTSRLVLVDGGDDRSP